MTYNTDIERLNYYEGEFLGAVDFQAEQEYHRDMRRRHNLGQHTWGIVTGLDLAQAPNGNTAPNGTAEVDVYLQPGMAVDGFGREIVVLGQVQLTPAMFAAYASSNASAMLLCVWIAYEESLLQPPSDACTSMNVSNAYARIGETYTLTVTQSGSSPSNTAIVVDGNQMAVPVQPSTASSTSSSGANATPDPPPITLPYDDSVPFQEFSTDDSALNWWLPLGQVLWDPSNQVFLQAANTEPVSSLFSTAYGRLYAGNVSATTYAPTGLYTIMDRNSAYPPPPSSSDPNLGGVQAEVAGSLQVDYLFNAEMTAVIGGAYHAATMASLSPLTIIASGNNEELIQFRNPLGQETWHICENLGGSNPGINFGEIVSGAPVDGRLFLESGGNVGIGTTAPQQNLSVNGGLNIDQANLNNGGSKLPVGSNNSLTFGSNSGEGIASCRVSGGTNMFGLDFYTDGDVQMSITQHGEVGIDQSNQNPGNSLIPGLVFGTHTIPNGPGGSGEGIASCRVSGGVNRYGLDFYTAYAVRMRLTQTGDLHINSGDVHISGHLYVGGVMRF